MNDHTASATQSRTDQANHEELLGLARVTHMTGLSKTTIYRLMRDEEFPKPIAVRRRALWPLSRVDRWVRDQIRKAESAGAGE